VVIVDDMYSGRLSNVPEGALFFQMDIRDKNLVEIFKEFKIDFVSHQAARGDVRGSILKPEEYADVNIRGGINILECCRLTSVTAIAFASSGGCVYGEPLYIPSDELHPVQPRDPYGATKACFEVYLKTYRQLYGLNYTIFRYPNVYGPFQNPHGDAGVISIITKAMLDNREVIINGTGEQIRDFVFIGDIVRANVMALTLSSSDTFNVGTGIGTDINTLVKNLADLTGYQGSILHGSSKLGEVSRSLLKSELIYSKWGWKPEVSLISGLAETVEFIRHDG
jgi:UDP-glucose 4-epimerase